MGRKAIEINKAKLIEVINLKEAERVYPNQNQLFMDIAPEFGCAPIIIRNRIAEWSIPLKTVKGKRGRQKGEGLPKGVIPGQRKPRRIKSEGNVALVNAFTLMNKQHHDETGKDIAGLSKTVDRCVNGSLKAAIKLKCLDCCAGQKDEIRQCDIKACPLWAFRPYSGKATSDETEVPVTA